MWISALVQNDPENIAQKLRPLGLVSAKEDLVTVEQSFGKSIVQRQNDVDDPIFWDERKIDVELFLEAT